MNTIRLHYEPGTEDNNPDALEIEAVPTIGDRIQLNSERVYIVAQRTWDHPGKETCEIRLWLVAEDREQIDWSELRKAAFSARFGESRKSH